MSSNRSSLSSSDDLGWRPAAAVPFESPIARTEEIQIVLLGAPGTGKTRLQSRYTLRQFVDVEFHGMGGHKHLHLPDGTDIHLIIHELKTGRTRGTRGRTTEEERYQEQCQRKRLLEQSDAVMLVFNPWSQASYEWIDDKIIQDVLSSGRKKQLANDILELLDGLVAAMPQRAASDRSAIDSVMKKLPRRPDELDGDNDSEVSIFSDSDEKNRGEDPVDYRGELKRISIVVEGSALKKAEFMIHEKDLPSPPTQSPTHNPWAVEQSTARMSKGLPTIREADESLRKQERVAVMMDRRHLPIKKHDNRFSLASDTSRSSTYSETMTSAISTNPTPDLSDSTHPFYRDSSTVSDAIPDDTAEAPNYQRSSTRTPGEETEMPVLVVATMTDRLRDRGGNLNRHITPRQGQRLARKFGPNCAYIETSAKTNANVDEAYGIIVDQVMAKRAASRRDNLARARIKAAVAAVQANPYPAKRAMPRASRSCMPQWSWLDDLMARRSFFDSWSEKSSGLPATTGGEELSGNESAPEDVWGEEMVKNPRKAHGLEGSIRLSHWRSKSSSVMSEPIPLSERTSQRVSPDMGDRTRSHDPTRDTSLERVIKETAGDDAVEVVPLDTAQPASRDWDIMPGKPDVTENPFEKDEFKRPMNMVTVTILEPPEDPVETKEQPRRRTEIFERLKRTGLRASSTIARPSPISNVGEYAPNIPPLAFDAVIIDDKRASVAVLVRAADQERNDESIEHFLNQDASHDSKVVRLSASTAAKTLSALVKEINSARGRRGANKVESLRVRNSRRASEGMPEVATLPGAESEIEKRVKRVTSPGVHSTQTPSSDEETDELTIVMNPGTADVAGVDKRSLGAIDEEPSLPTTLASSTPASIDKVLPITPPTPPPALKTAPPPPRKSQTFPSSPPAPKHNKQPPPALPPIPKTLPAAPAAVFLASRAKDSLLPRAPIITTPELPDSDSNGEEWQKPSKRPRGPPNPRRAQDKLRSNKRMGLAPPARPQNPVNRPLSAWV